LAAMRAQSRQIKPMFCMTCFAWIAAEAMGPNT
jgi:hypothetical protein